MKDTLYATLRPNGSICRYLTCSVMPFRLGPPMAFLFSTLASKSKTEWTSSVNLSLSPRYCSKVIWESVTPSFSARATARPDIW
jgi:hypothetical protein